MLDADSHIKTPGVSHTNHNSVAAPARLSTKPPMINDFQSSVHSKGFDEEKNCNRMSQVTQKLNLEDLRIE